MSSKSSVTAYSLNFKGSRAPAATIAGPLTGLSYPTSVAVDRAGEISVLDQKRILKFPSGADGNVPPSTIIAGPATMIDNYAIAIAIDERGFILLLKSSGLIKFAPGSKGNTPPSAYLGNPQNDYSKPKHGFDGAVGFAIDSLGNIYVTTNANRVLAYRAGSSGDATPSWTLSGAMTGLEEPSSIAVDAEGNVYVLNRGSPSVTVYSRGSRGGTVPSATIFGPATQLHSPRAIAVDPAGNVYVADSSAVVAFVAGANGDVAPKAIISGPEAGWNSGTAVAVGP